LVNRQSHLPVFHHTVQTAFVTGAAGFIGSQVVRRLIEQGVQVRALVRTLPAHQPAAATLAQDAVELIVGDLRAPERWRGRLQGCDTVFHIAALYSAQPADAPLLYQVNVHGVQAMLSAAAAAGVRCVVHTSTIGVLGRPADDGLADEDTPFNLWRTASDYVRSKWLGEAAALLWNRRGLPVVVVNPTAPVGAGDARPTATGQRIVDFLAGKRPDYPAGGLNLCPVDDIAVGHLLAAQAGQPGRRYILGHAQGNLQEAAFLGLLAAASGLSIPNPVERPAGRRPFSLTADPSRAIRELGMPQSDLQAAIAEAVTFYRTFGAGF
jgi:dihydroflavonol-4-reductase